MANMVYTEDELHEMEIRKGTVVICKNFFYTSVIGGFAFQFVDGTIAIHRKAKQSILEIIETSPFGFIAKDLDTGLVHRDVSGAFALM